MSNVSLKNKNILYLFEYNVLLPNDMLNFFEEKKSCQIYKTKKLS